MAIDFAKHLKRAHLVSFSLLVVFSLIDWAIAAWLVAHYNKHGYPNHSIRDRTRFLLFTGLWTFVFSFVYIFGLLKAASSFAFSIASHAIFLFITWVFWLSGAAAITAALGDNWKGGNSDTLYALEGFAWICWIITTFLFSFVLFAGTRAARGGNGFGGALVESA
ncbi:hypothetical protein JCM10213_003719 [Rhodosporidiobolus nylandii]